MIQTPKWRFFRNWWLSVSIRKKMFFFIALVIFMVLFITFFCIGMLHLYLRDFNDVLGDSHTVNDVVISFEKEHESYVTYANDRINENRIEFLKNRTRTISAIFQLRFDYHETSIRRYLITQAIRTSHQAYISYCDHVLCVPYESEEFIEGYYQSIKVADYIHGYFTDLMQITLAEGNQDYYNKVRIFRILPIFAMIMATVIILFAFVLYRVTVRHMITPVLKLADASRKITDNQLCEPDIQVPNRDEIGELVRTFNIMKHTTAHSITALREKNEMASRLHEEELARINTEKMLKTMQMSLLQSQINPHFLFNTLNIISRTAKIETAKSTEELILRLANLFRYNLQTASERVPLTRELNIIYDYIYIQQVRFGPHINFHIDCRIDANKLFVPTFTLQPLVENAVIHGVGPMEEGGQIRIRIKKKNDWIVLSVTDSGGGIAPERLQKLMDGTGEHHKGHLSGIGIGNVKTRMELLYPKTKFSIFSRLGLGTAIRMMLPAASVKVEEDNHEVSNCSS